MASARDLAKVLCDINNLAFQEEEDQFGRVRPSFHGYKHWMKLLLELTTAGSLLEPSDVTTDRNGHLRVSWFKGVKEVELICPFEGLPYVYFSYGEDYGTDTCATAEKVAERIRWAMDVK